MQLVVKDSNHSNKITYPSGRSSPLCAVLCDAATAAAAATFMEWCGQNGGSGLRADGICTSWPCMFWWLWPWWGAMGKPDWVPCKLYIVDSLGEDVLLGSRTLEDWISEWRKSPDLASSTQIGDSRFSEWVSSWLGGWAQPVQNRRNTAPKLVDHLAGEFKDVDFFF